MTINFSCTVAKIVVAGHAYCLLRLLVRGVISRSGGYIWGLDINEIKINTYIIKIFKNFIYT